MSTIPRVPPAIIDSLKSLPSGMPIVQTLNGEVLTSDDILALIEYAGAATAPPIAEQTASAPVKEPS